MGVACVWKTVVSDANANNFTMPFLSSDSCVNQDDFTLRCATLANPYTVLNCPSNGQVFIQCGGGSNLVEVLTTSMQINVPVYAPSFNSTSDDRAKFKETPIGNGLEVVRQLEPQTYDKVNGEFVDELASDTVTSKEAGLIAQELYQILPDAVTPGDETTPWVVNYNHVLVFALAAIQDLDSLVQAQAARIAALEAKKTRTSKTAT